LSAQLRIDQWDQSVERFTAAVTPFVQKAGDVLGHGEERIVPKHVTRFFDSCRVEHCRRVARVSFWHFF
jgi:hypothetical protein